MSKFRFAGRASITHLNTRKEGPDEEKELAVDVKLQALCGVEAAGYFEPELAGFMFLEGGAVRNTMMGPITFSHELEDYRLEAVGSTFHGVKVKKFSLEPVDGNQVRLTFSISFKPSGDEVARMAEYLQDEIDIAIMPTNEELGFEEAA